MRSKLSVTVYLFLALYGSTTLQSQLFLKIILRTFFASRNWWIIVVFLQCTLKEKLPFILINTLLLHIPLLALTDGQNDGRTETKYTCCTWAGGPFLHLCCCVSFLFWQEIGFGFTQITAGKKRYSHLVVGWNKSQITVCRVKIQTPPITLYFKKFLIGFLYFTETIRSKLSVTV